MENVWWQWKPEAIFWNLHTIWPSATDQLRSLIFPSLLFYSDCLQRSSTFSVNRSYVLSTKSALTLTHTGWQMTTYYLPTWYIDYYLFIKYYFPLHVLSLSAHLQEDTDVYMQAYGTVTLYESSWWPVGTQLEWELTVGGTTFPLQSVLTQTVYRQATRNSRVPYAACIQLYPPEDEHLRLETCRGKKYFMNK